VREKLPIEDLPEVMRLVAKVERALGDEGRVLVRYSGTEAKARVMFEGPDQGRIKEYAEDIAKAIEKACGAA
jgi:phosphoglucosamine mutase